MPLKNTDNMYPTRAAVLETVGDGEGRLEDGVGPGLLHVVPRDGDGVELGHVLQGKEEIGVIILTGLWGYIGHVLQ